MADLRDNVKPFWKMLLTASVSGLLMFFVGKAENAGQYREKVDAMEREQMSQSQDIRDLREDRAVMKEKLIQMAEDIRVIRTTLEQRKNVP